MSYGPTPYDKKKYKESKRRRKQAMIAEQTGRILPFSTVRRRVIVCVCIAAAVLCAGIGVYFVCFNYDNVGMSVNTNTSGTEGYNESSELLTVINTGNMLEPDYVPQLENFGDFKVNTLACGDLKDLVSQALKDGIELDVVSAYISYDEQQLLYEEKFNSYLSNSQYTEVRAAAAAQKSVPKAGCSEAQTGLLIGFDVSDPSTEAYLQRNCIKYGFIQRYTADKADVTKMNENKSLFRYVGSDNAQKMRALNMCLEEYSDYIILQKNQ